MFVPVAPLMPFFAHTVGWALLGWVVAWLGGKRIKVSFHATEDLQLFGLLGALWAYGVDECAPVDKLLRDAPFAGKAMPATLPRELPDLVTIQSESFFDARRAYPQLKPELLVNFDTLKAEGIQHGALRVVAWGANTVRTEFAYLSGLDSEVLGVHRYNPYRRLARYGVPTVASYLRQLGYRTVCVHPYHASFYARNEILPILGFDEFIDIRAFADAKRDGPYVGDRAVANQVNELLRREGGA
ncbi:MAG: sulfatase-like hydrolase/transferase, partial [Achromobacter pestifer]